MKYLQFYNTLNFIQEIFQQLNYLISKYYYTFQIIIIKSMKTSISNFINENKNNKNIQLINIINKIFDENKKNKLNEMKNSKTMNTENKTNLNNLIIYYNERIDEIKREINEQKINSESK